MTRPACSLLVVLLVVLLHGTAAVTGSNKNKQTPFFSLKCHVASCSNKIKQVFAQPEKRSKQIEKPVLSPRWARFFYILSASNPVLSVFYNDYSRMLEPFELNKRRASYLAKTYETIFYFAKLKPRVSFAIGAVLRALQLTTPIRLIFDPSAGVGLGLNVICYMAGSRWPAVGVLGWSATKSMWAFLGACPPKRGASVPIVISMQQRQNKEAKTYRLGI